MTKRIRAEQQLYRNRFNVYSVISFLLLLLFDVYIVLILITLGPEDSSLMLWYELIVTLFLVFRVGKDIIIQ